MKNKIKIIDLLNKIANGEEVPKKIKYASTEYEFSGYDTASKNYKCEYEGGFYSDLFSDIDGSCLNDEVEILDDKEDEKAEIPVFEPYHIFNHDADNFTGVKTYINGKEVFSLASEIEEDKDIPLIPDDELIILKQEKAIDMQKAIDYNFKVLKEKINQVVKEFNEYRKENK